MAYIDLDNLEKAIDLLKKRGVLIRDIAEITHEIQSEYYSNLTIEYCDENVLKVLEKTEVQNVIFTGIALDMMCEQGHVPEPLNEMMKTDYPLYGVDEILALGIVNVYGSIGLTNFGYVDKKKIGIIGRVDKLGKENETCNTFLDDIIGAIAAAAASRIAHNKQGK